MLQLQLGIKLLPCTVDDVLRSTEAPVDGDDAGPVAFQRARHFQPPVSLVQVRQVPASHLHRHHLLDQEGVHEDGTPAARENLKAQVGILVVASAPAIVDPIEDQQGAVHVDVAAERRRPGDAEHVVIHAADRDVLVAVEEVFDGGEGRAGVAGDSASAMEPIDLADVVVKDPVAIVSRSQ